MRTPWAPSTCWRWVVIRANIIGQLSRHMAWVRKNLAKDTDGDGMIVGFELDDKLRAARDAHQSTKTALVADDGSVTMRLPKARR